MALRLKLVICAAALAVAGAGVASLRLRGGEAAPPHTYSVGEARAIGAQWRRAPTDALAVNYARALAAAGLYEELLMEIGARGLLAEDPPLRNLLRSEAYYRLGRYAEALAAPPGTGPVSPPLALVRARAIYALTADPDAARAALAAAFRGAPDLAAEAWLFRARLALDANDDDGADAASRRAAEAGAAAERLAAIAIERAIRAGRIDAARRALSAPRRFARRRSPDLAPDDRLRLAGLLALKSGDAAAAARFFDLIPPLAADESRVRLLAALAKWRAGDRAQAHAHVAAALAAAPEDWAALDLAQAIAADLRRDDERASLLGRLAEARPALALARRAQGAEGGARDTIFALLADWRAEPAHQGAASWLMGDDADAPQWVRDPNADDRAAIALAAALARQDLPALRKQAHAAHRADAAPLLLAMAGRAFAHLGDAARADDAFAKASLADPGFFTPVRLRAERLARADEGARALDLLRRFCADNPDRADAAIALAKLEFAEGEGRRARQRLAELPPPMVFSDLEAAQIYASAAVAHGPDAVAAMLAAAEESAASGRVLGAVRMAVGDAPGAAKAYRDGLLENPGDPDLPNLYYSAMAQIGRADEARSFLAELARRAPTASAARNILASSGVSAAGPVDF
jgi:hypothetical protein